MKFYCQNCGSVFESGERVFLYEGETTVYFCPECKMGMNKRPIYETPENYKRRNAREYPDNGLVWIIFESKQGWISMSYAGAKNCSSLYKPIIVIADPPYPPPIDYKPEEPDDRPMPFNMNEKK